MKLTIDPEFKSLIPPLSDDEYNQLEANLKAEGCRDPLVTWDGIILDGHNRFEICTRNGIGFEKITKRFADRSEAIEWIIRNQFGRRNLDGYQRTKLALRLEATIAERAKAKQDRERKTGGALAQKSAESPIETREEIAKLAGVSRDTVDKVKQIERRATPEIKAALAKGEISINKAHQTVKQQREPEDESETIIADGTKEDDKPKRRSPMKIIESEGMRIWNIAKSQLDRINKHDEFREKALSACIQYCESRLKNKK